jgi:hypothetical protein
MPADAGIETKMSDIFWFISPLSTIICHLLFSEGMECPSREVAFDATERDGILQQCRYRDLASISE